MLCSGKLVQILLLKNCGLECMTLLIYSPVLPLSSKCGLNQGVPNGLDKKTWKKKSHAEH